MRLIVLAAVTALALLGQVFVSLFYGCLTANLHCRRPGIAVWLLIAVLVALFALSVAQGWRMARGRRRR